MKCSSSGRDSGGKGVQANFVKFNYAWIFENRVSKDKDLFDYLAIKNNKIRPKADKKARIWRWVVCLWSLEAFQQVKL